MDINEEIRAAFADAGETMACITGKANNATHNATIAGKPYLGVFGPAQVDRSMLPAGGYRQRTFLQWVALRSQFTAPPPVNTVLVRVDLDSPIEYRIERVNTHDPVHYVCVLVRVGE